MDRVRVGPVQGLRIAVAAFTLSVLLFALVIGGAVYLLTVKSSEATETRNAICALRSDLEVRTEGSRDFLREHPRGIAGIPASAIRESVQNQERSIGALGDVDCPS